MKGSPLRFASSVALALGLLAQSPTQAPGTGTAGPSTTSSDEATAKMGVTGRLVLLNVLVQHRGGNPVGGLSKADFEVTDAGRPQAINLFSVNQLPTANSQAARPLPRNVVTNRPIRQDGASPNVTVLLIDSYNSHGIELRNVKRALLKSLNKVPPEDEVAIYMLNSNGFTIVHDFTNNAETLKAAVANVPSKASHGLEGAAADRGITGTDRTSTVVESKLTSSNFLTSNRIANTRAALRTVADHLSGILGRKNLIWITGSIPMELFGNLEGKLGTGNHYLASYASEAGQDLNNANVAIYPVDPRPMMSQCSFQASQSPPDPRMLPGPQTTPGAPIMQKPPILSCTDYDQNGTTMAHLAEITGGKAFHDIAHAVRQAIDDSAVTYTLGYYVAASDWNNGYHNIQVAVRRPGMNVRTKKGYLAQDKPAPNNGRLEAALNDAVWSPLNSTRLNVTARIDPSPDLPNASRFSIAIEPAELNLREENGKYRGVADVLFMQEQRGQHGPELMKTFNIALTPERYKVLMASGMILAEDLPMQPDTVAVRIIVVDHSSGATGSITIAVGPEDKSSNNVVPPAR